jgi:hypothetical protein
MSRRKRADDVGLEPRYDPTLAVQDQGAARANRRELDCRGHGQVRLFTREEAIEELDYA